MIRILAILPSTDAYSIVRGEPIHADLNSTPIYDALSYTWGENRRKQAERVVPDDTCSTTRPETLHNGTCIEKKFSNENEKRHLSPEQSDRKNCLPQKLVPGFGVWISQETKQAEQKRNIDEGQANTTTTHNSNPETKIRQLKCAICDAMLLAAAACCCILFSRYSQARRLRTVAMTELQSKPKDQSIFAYGAKDNYSNSVSARADLQGMLDTVAIFLVRDLVTILWSVVLRLVTDQARIARAGDHTKSRDLRRRMRSIWLLSPFINAKVRAEQTPTFSIVSCSRSWACS